MIKGIGIDTVERERVSRIFTKYGEKFENKILGHNEKKEFNLKKNNRQKIRYLSNSFAVKEAFSKVIGLGFSNGVSPKEIEVLRDPKGKPYIKLNGKTKDIAKNLQVNNISVSLTDTYTQSTAFVIGEKL